MAFSNCGTLDCSKPAMTVSKVILVNRDLTSCNLRWKVEHGSSFP